MRITHQHRFDAPLDAVVRMLQDEDCVRARAKAAGAADVDVLVDVLDDGTFTVSVRRAVESASIPSEFRSLVGSELLVRYTEAWDAPSEKVKGREGTFALEIAGAPGHARGSIVLTPDGNATAFGLAGEVQASIPLVGPMVEKTMVAAVKNSLPRELEAADAWLRKNA